MFNCTQIPSSRNLSHNGRFNNVSGKIEYSANVQAVELIESRMVEGICFRFRRRKHLIYDWAREDMKRLNKSTCVCWVKISGYYDKLKQVLPIFGFCITT